MRAALALGLLLTAGPASAASISTVDLRDYCLAVERYAADRVAGRKPTEDTALQASVCTFFIEGFASGELLAQQTFEYRPLYCLPKNTNARQLAAVFVKHANENPENWNKAAYFTLSMALITTFPCRP